MDKNKLIVLIKFKFFSEIIHKKINFKKKRIDLIFKEIKTYKKRKF